MNKWITSLFAVALTGSVAFADVAAPAVSAKDLEKVVDEAIYVETNTKGIVLSGYVDAGYIYNFTGVDAVAGRAANDGVAQGDFSLNAIKLTLEKALTDANEFQAGFRADIKLGEDAGFMGGAGNGALAPNNGDSFNLDQAYVIVRAPIGNGLDITAGKFASLLGYEVDDRPANLNITYGYDWVFMTSQQTGLKLYYPINDILEAQVAITNGTAADTSTVGGGGNPGTDAYGLSATLNIKAPGGNANWFHGIYSSMGTGADGLTGENESSLLYNTWGNWAPKFANDKLLLGAVFSIGDVADDTLAGDGYTFVNPSLYAKYQFTDIFSLAGRASYFHSSDEANTIAAPGVGAGNGGTDLFSWTATAGFNLLENLLVRAEYRVDLGNDVTVSNDAAHTFAAQVVYTF